MLLRNSQLHPAFIFVLLASSGAIFRCRSARLDENASDVRKVQTKGSRTVVKTAKGSVRGFIAKSSLGKPVRVFYGIPYAQPPTGKQRFRFAKPNQPWRGVFDATVKPNSCVQRVDNTNSNFSGTAKWNANTNLSEDCLKLNVWTPVPPREKPAAVLVWIYGGGFFSGTSTLDFYDPRTLVSVEGVLVVSMNYRVASLGFLSFGNKLVPGNAGLYDQYMALKWVHDNIAAFGGDPGRVTLFGESSGAFSVAMHILSPLSRNLFRGAILQSGSAVAPWGFQSRRMARKAARRLARTLRCPVSLDQKTLNCLLNKDPKEIVYSEKRLNAIVGPPYTPVADGTFLQKSPEALIDEMAFRKKIYILLGSNLNEGSIFLQRFFRFSKDEQNPHVSKENFTGVVEVLNPSLGKPPMDAVLGMYTGGKTPLSSSKKLKVLDSIVGDYHFTCPVVRFADRLANAGVCVYEYVFTHRSSCNPWPQWVGVMHSEEISFVFGEPFNETFKYSIRDKIVSARLMRYWANFAKTGDPNLPRYGAFVRNTWPQRSIFHRQHLVLNVEERVGFAYRAVYCRFWEKIRHKWTPVA